MAFGSACARVGMGESAHRQPPNTGTCCSSATHLARVTWGKGQHRALSWKLDPSDSRQAETASPMSSTASCTPYKKGTLVLHQVYSLHTAHFCLERNAPTHSVQYRGHAAPFQRHRPRASSPGFPTIGIRPFVCTRARHGPSARLQPPDSQVWGTCHTFSRNPSQCDHRNQK